MYKVSYDLGKVSKHMKLSFGLIMFGSPDAKKPKNNQPDIAINKFCLHGNSYLKFSPRPYVTIDINKSGDKNDGWNVACTTTLNRMRLYQFLNICRLFMKKYENKDLYFIKNGKLYLNNDLIQESTMVLPADSNHTAVMLSPAIISDGDIVDNRYEGVMFSIANIGNSTIITYPEFQYLVYILSTLDMSTLSMALINAYLLYDKDSLKEGVPNGINAVRYLPPKVIVEKPSTEVTVKPPPKPQQEKEIPDI